MLCACEAQYANIAMPDSTLCDRWAFDTLTPQSSPLGVAQCPPPKLELFGKALDMLLASLRVKV